MADHQEETAIATESQLDALLTEYLHLLDRYTLLRAQLSTHLASGFLALAHANRSAAHTLGAGRRYGEDAYDGRMRATRRWFGLLVPPALRQCQSHFTHSVAATIPELLTIMAEMRAAEDEIVKVRRELGLEERDGDTKSQDTAHPHPTNAYPPTPPSTSSNHPLTTFVSRSRRSEPRPRVLTLDGASLS
ncbi:hypothetical protein DV736_g1500, partial [Chaetothyriales sp. CBS 134916]